MNQHASRKTYVYVYGVLIALTALTTAMAYVDLRAVNIYVALTIALIKGTLVVLFFMHVRESSGMTRVYVAAGFFGWPFCCCSPSRTISPAHGRHSDPYRHLT